MLPPSVPKGWPNSSAEALRKNPQRKVFLNPGGQQQNSFCGNAIKTSRYGNWRWFWLFHYCYYYYRSFLNLQKFGIFYLCFCSKSSTRKLRSLTAIFLLYLACNASELYLTLVDIQQYWSLYPLCFWYLVFLKLQRILLDTKLTNRYHRLCVQRTDGKYNLLWKCFVAGKLFQNWSS